MESKQEWLASKLYRRPPALVRCSISPLKAKTTASSPHAGDWMNHNHRSGTSMHTPTVGNHLPSIKTRPKIYSPGLNRRIFEANLAKGLDLSILEPSFRKEANQHRRKISGSETVQKARKVDSRDLWKYARIEQNVIKGKDADTTISFVTLNIGLKAVQLDGRAIFRVRPEQIHMKSESLLPSTVHLPDPVSHFYHPPKKQLPTHLNALFPRTHKPKSKPDSTDPEAIGPW